MLIIVLCCSCLLSCGKKGPLKLEAEKLPLQVESFKLRQLGQEICLEWSFPGYLSDQESVFEFENIGKILVYYSDKEIAENKFRKKSILLKKRKLDDLIQKEKTYFLKIPFKLKELNDKIHYFALRYYYGKKKSPLSTIRSIKTIVPVKPISDLTVLRENKVIKLKWTKPGLDRSGNKIKKIAGYKVYRKVVGVEETGEQEEDFTLLNKDALLYEYYEDSDTGMDGEYSYYVSVTGSAAIESEPSNTAVLELTDVFPPEPPQNLVVFKHKDHMFITWEKTGEKDFSHYVVYRKSDRLKNEELKPIAGKVSDNYYKDSKVNAGVTYFYCITAVDDKDNESKRSNIVKEKF